MISMHEEVTDWSARARHSDPGLMLGDVENLGSSHMANLERPCDALRRATLRFTVG